MPNFPNPQDNMSNFPHENNMPGFRNKHHQLPQKFDEFFNGNNRKKGRKNME